VNKRTPADQRPLTDCQQVLCRMEDARYASLIDLKAGYHNVRWDSTNCYSVFATHVGKYRWLRMPFGLTNAPAHFQWAMEDIINGAGPWVHRANS
jgi:Reverse transcriptase (RNA-dependent DNA polymerase)